jgi:hypothetical protein
MNLTPSLRHAACGLIAVLLCAGCGGTEPSAAAPQSGALSGGLAGGEASLQTPPFAEGAAPSEAGTGAPGAAPAAADFSSVAANFDPDVQRFIWVLPPGVHGQGPWSMRAEVRHRGELKFKTDLPLLAETLASGSRTEFPDGYEVLRLRGDGRWREQTAEMDAVILGLIEQYGRGEGEVTFFTRLNAQLDPAARQAYCTDGRTADIRVYVEQAGEPDLTPLTAGGVADAFSRVALMEACGR